jgi:hypothetical protein
VSTRIPFRGYLLDQASIDAFLVAEKLTGWTLPVMQGSWSTGVAASAGTHAGGGAIDVGLRDAAGNLRSAWEQTWTVRNLRRAGFRAWRRTPAQGFPYHAHGILGGDPLVSPDAAAQLVQWDRGLNGLADHGSDDDPIDVAAGRPAVLPRGAAVPRTMYDAVTVANIPAGALMVAGYVDGHYANLAAMRARFPHALIVPIAVRASTNDGLVLDIETGDATPAEGPGWVTMRRAAGEDPSVYCNTSTWPAVKAAFASAGVTPPHYWVAQYDGNPAIPAGAVAKQYSNPGPFDISAVADHWPGIDKGADMPLNSADAKLVVDLMVTRRDELAMAGLYWLRRALDPTLPLPTGPNLPGVVAEAQHLREYLAAQQAGEKAAIKAVQDDLAALSALLTSLESPTAAQVQAGMEAAFAKLGQILAAGPVV